MQPQTQLKPFLLQIPGEIGLQVTSEQFYRLAAVNHELKLERSAQGELIVTPPTGGETGRRNAKISTQLGIWCAQNEELGEYFDSSTGYELPNGANRSPDASWVKRERWESLTLAQKESFIPLSPDFVIELQSNSDRSSDLQAKMQEYIANGTQLGWLISPKQQQVEIYRADRSIEVLQKPTIVSGENLLPGFQLNLDWMWK